jgi:hypothetical protein
MNASLIRTCEGQNFAEPALLCLAPIAGEAGGSVFFRALNGTLSNRGHSSYHRAAKGSREADYALIAIGAKE